MDEKQMDCSKKTLRRKLDLLLRTGQILMESSADTSRVKRNMERTAAYLGLPKENLHMNIDYYMLQVNVSDEYHSFSKMQRCDKHVINMLAIQEISKLSWRAIQKDYSLDKYEEELEKIANGKHYYKDWMIAIGAGLACGGFCIQFGCDWTAFFYASIAAILGNRLRMFLNHSGSNLYANFAVAAFVSTILAWLSSFLSTPTVQAALPEFLRPILFTETPWHPLLACALYIVPGVPLINAVNDLLDNHINTGLVRAMNTLLIVIAMSFGIMLAIKCGSFDGFAKDLPTIPHHSFYVYAVAAAISAMGFATIYNIPYRLMPWIAVGGIICVCTRNFVFLDPSTGNAGLGLGIVVGSLCGSALISIINIKAVHILHTPHQCITIPAVIPIVPGVLMYRALYGFMGMQGVVGEVTHAMSFAINGSLVLVCIALGVAIPNIFAKKWIAPHRKAKLQRMIDERRQRGKFVDLHQYNI
ncbi:threonine/serine ThrE exporter family protein [Prevotella melaninogenica]|uniref:threonine/serine ThrE exporter family protein n=1 Tax=Prevotella melaninogenica TaxID=28132 RepID=UPI001C5E3B54|nr:threonine/serine exporter family protein [Prevotella melaninogenica]MBW4729435.1 threonine/serine exporter family protein [Prevotella melaninogenica]MBW4732129.1 threonine/serine exporter family protein [Prevotella melaninogenica]MBW4750061.1 threonine/serine exporter family protein [Prevotella melaninogenica]